MFRGYAIIGHDKRGANEDDAPGPVLYLYLPNEKHDIKVKNHLNSDVWLYL